MIAKLLKILAGVGWLALLVNEIRGAILAVPVLVGMWQAGGDLMAIWLGLCTLAGIALSVIVPIWLARKITRKEQHESGTLQVNPV